MKDADTSTMITESATNHTNDSRIKQNKEERCSGSLPYTPLENHGVIGNMLTSALVTTEASINWMCYPHFDSPALFCAILDKDKGGFWSISPDVAHFRTKQVYWPDTNVLVTKFLNDEGVGQIIDYMPVITHHPTSTKIKEYSLGHKWLVRRISVARGSMNFKFVCKPSFNFALDEHKVQLLSENHALFESKDLVMMLHAQKGQLKIKSPSGEVIEKPNDVVPQGMIFGDLNITEGENVSFILREPDDNWRNENLCEISCWASKSKIQHDKEEKKQQSKNKVDISSIDPGCLTPDLKLLFSFEDVLFKGTVSFWQRWIEKCTYVGKWREMVRRSALVLKLLTFCPTGAIVAAPTCSLPEEIGGVRNWDYRFTWIRDASFTLYGLMRIGLTEEAGAFMNWLEERCLDMNPKGEMPLSIMYTIDGSAEIPEQTLGHLSGYMNSAPVRIGNGAAKQKQLDIFGELLDSVYLYNKYGALISYDFWCHLRRMLEWLGEHWKDPDEGIWEMRTEKKHYTYSKMMCWVAFDRGLRLCDRRSFPAPREKWQRIRDEIYEDIMKNGWSEERRAFVQYYGSTALDASVLIAPLVFFIAPNDPLWLSTLEKLTRSPNEGGLLSNSLVFRYNLGVVEDGFMGDEGTFNICSFWMIEALTRAGAIHKEKYYCYSEERLIENRRMTFANGNLKKEEGKICGVESVQSKGNTEGKPNGVEKAEAKGSNEEKKENGKEKTGKEDEKTEDEKENGTENKKCVRMSVHSDGESTSPCVNVSKGENITSGDILSKARLMFEEILSYSNHLGIYGEETGFSGNALGNIPQAFTHLALISCAFNLDKAR
eukprot:TRINITY_DN13471_c0_g1_i1.p1 TRINITY_DN13471_c0_g1~~TRINITY_DN13471_c0_g1_i1.p1  ORF type:complete len:828 (+),score=173.71 TRINITY_DN13471_c0_g1_i1:191-2674(+)